MKELNLPASLKEIQKLRKAFNIQYSKFAKDYNELGKRFRQITIDADLMLAAAEEMMMAGAG